MDLDRLLHDPAYDLPVPPDGLALVDARAGRIRRRRRLAVAAPLALLVLASGPSVATLGDGAARLDSAVAPSPAATAHTWRDPVTPVTGTAPEGTRDRFGRLAAQVDVIDAGVQRVMGRCMGRKGFPYEEGWSDHPPSEEVLLSGTRDLSVAQAQQRGYGIAERVAAEDRLHPNDVYLSSVGETRRSAWYAAVGDGPMLTATFDQPFQRGYSVGVAGCSREAVVAIWGGAEEYGVASFVVNSIGGEIVGQSRDDAELLALDAAWSRCMERSGHGGLSRPLEAASRASDAYSGDQQAAREQELEIALADARCREELDLDRRRTAVEDRYLAGMVEQYPGVLQRIEQTLSAAQARAEAELAKPR